MFSFIHAADIHLDSPLKGLERYEGAPVDEIRGATRRAMENLVEIAIERDVDFLLIAGDLYDGDWKDHNTGLFFVSQVVKLRDAGIPVFVISGNHDAANKMTKSLRLPKNADGSSVMLSHKTPETLIVDDVGVAIHGRGFATATVTENVVDTYPAKSAGFYNIGLLHTSLDSESVDEHSRYAPCKLSDLAAKQYDYWALGHIHHRNIRNEDPTIVFPGNIQGRHVRETGAKGCVLVTVDDRGQTQVQFESLDVLRWEKCVVDASNITDCEELIDTCMNEVSKRLQQNDGMTMAVRIVIQGETPIHRQLHGDQTRWTNQVRAAAIDVSGGQVWLEKIKLQTSPVADAVESMTSSGPVSELVSYIDSLQADQGQLASLAESLGDLRRKLPDELKSGMEALALDDPKQLREVLEDIKPLLLDELLQEARP